MRTYKYICLNPYLLEVASQLKKIGKMMMRLILEDNRLVRYDDSSKDPTSEEDDDVNHDVAFNFIGLTT